MEVKRFYREDGTLFYEEYSMRGRVEEEYRLKHKFLPKLLMCDKNGNMIVEQYYIIENNGYYLHLLIKEIEEKTIIDYKNLPITREEYYKNNKIYRDNGPAVIEYYDNGNIKSEYYYKDYKKHNNNGPAVIEYYDNGNIKSEEYYKDGKKHNDKGPGFISYNEDGSIKNKTYWLNGKKVKDVLQLSILKTL